MRLSEAYQSDIRGPFTRIKVIETGLEFIWYQGKRIEVLDAETEDVRLEFNVEFHNHEGLNWGLVRIIQPDPRVDIQRIPVGAHLDLEAGWRHQSADENLQLRYWVIERVRFTRNSDESYGVEILMYDSAEEMLRTIVSRSYLPGVKASTVFMDLYNSFLGPRGISLVSYQPQRDVVYRRGRAFPAIPLRFAIEGVARDMESRVFIWNRRLFLHGPDKVWQTSLLLEPETGLLLAEPIFSSNEPRPSLADPRASKFYIRAFMHPLMTPDAEFGLNHRYFRGRFRILSGRHYSDGDAKWYSEVEASPRGALAGLLGDFLSAN